MRMTMYGSKMQRDRLFQKLYSDALISHLIELISPSLKYLKIKPTALNLSLLSSVPSAAVEIPPLEILGTEPITLSDFRALFKVSTLRHITLKFLGYGVYNDEDLIKSAVGTSPLTSLSFPSVILPYRRTAIGWPFTLKIDHGPLLMIAKLIAWTRQLKSFHLGLGDGPDVEILLQTGFMKLVLKHNSSLEEMFIDFRACRTTRRLPAGLSIAGFAHLRRLGMAEVFLSHHVVELSTTQLWQLLPNTLEELQIEFSSAFEDDLGASQIFWANCNTLLPTYEVVALNDSLHGILSHRFDHFPHLRNLVLWCRGLDNKITMQSRYRPLSFKSHALGSRLEVAADAVEFWLGLFGLPTNSQRPEFGLNSLLTKIRLSSIPCTLSKGRQFESRESDTESGHMPMRSLFRILLGSMRDLLSLLYIQNSLSIPRGAVIIESWAFPISGLFRRTQNPCSSK
ncbi:hypothetical protein N431DRAFT_522122, partial [Stipitochalara longipes BDJ]